jgi:HEAT repeat protein
MLIMNTAVDDLLTTIRSAGGAQRERALRVGAETLPESAMIELLRDEADDVARNTGLEMLKLRGRRSFVAAAALLDDPDDDVVLQAVLLLDSIGDPRAWPLLRPLLRRSNENIQQAVIAASGRLASPAAAADVVLFLDSSLWLQMAALQVLGLLRSRNAVRPIAALLDDPFLGDPAAESLARIGGPAAARAFAERWTAAESTLDAARWLPLLAQALAENEAPLSAPTLRSTLLRYLDAPDRIVATAAAQSVLSLGAGDDDGKALEVLLAGVNGAESLPRCLIRRDDLAECLLTSETPALRAWGYELVRRNRQAVPAAVLQRVIVESPPSSPEVLAAIIPHIGDTATLVALHIGMPAARDIIAPLLHQHPISVWALLEAMPNLDQARGLLLRDAAGLTPDYVADAVATLPVDERLTVVAQMHSRAVIARLPWLQWLDADRSMYARLLGEVVASRRVRELMPLVRHELAHDPLPPLVVCAGAMRDRASLRFVIDALSRCAPSARSAVFDSIAAIGGPNARKVLHSFATCGERIDERLSARAIARHATVEDCALLRRLAASDDWAVRLHAAETLAKFPDAENMAVLTTLAADATALVAQRARRCLNALGSTW